MYMHVMISAIASDMAPRFMYIDRDITAYGPEVFVGVFGSIKYLSRCPIGPGLHCFVFIFDKTGSSFLFIRTIPYKGEELNGKSFTIVCRAIFTVVIFSTALVMLTQLKKLI